MHIPISLINLRISSTSSNSTVLLRGVGSSDHCDRPRGGGVVTGARSWWWTGGGGGVGDGDGSGHTRRYDRGRRRQKSVLRLTIKKNEKRAHRTPVQANHGPRKKRFLFSPTHPDPPRAPPGPPRWPHSACPPRRRRGGPTFLPSPPPPPRVGSRPLAISRRGGPRGRTRRTRR